MNGPPQPGWVARCASASREAPLECAIEETAVLTKTGELVVLVNIRVANDTHAPIAVVQLPLGLSLRAGAKLQVDDGKPLDLQIETCENRGCCASTPVAPDLLAALQSGKKLKVSFQNLGKETITIPMPLTDFGSAYDKINCRGHLRIAGADLAELLVLVRGDRHLHELPGEFERARHDATSGLPRSRPDVESLP
jgi:invasion protein IalB